MLCRLQCARFAKRMAHCRRTFRQPSALTRSPPTFKRRQAACESLAGRLHSERDNIVSSDVTLVVRVKPSPKEISSCSKTPYQAARQHALKQERIETNGDGVKPGSTSPMGLGGANVQLGRMRPSLNIFLGSPPKVFSVGLRSVPVCFGVIRALMQRQLGGCGVQRHGRVGRHTNFVKLVYFCARVNYNANRK